MQLNSGTLIASGDAPLVIDPFAMPAGGLANMYYFQVAVNIPALRRRRAPAAGPLAPRNQTCSVTCGTRAERSSHESQ
jgi:hypothetical protein